MRKPRGPPFRIQERSALLVREPEDVSVPDSDVGNVYDLAITPSGQATAAWESYDDDLGHRVIQAAVAPARGSFGDPEAHHLVSYASTPRSRTRRSTPMASPPSRGAMRLALGTAEVHAATRAANGVCASAQKVSDDVAASTGQDVVVDAAGTSTVIWTTQQPAEPMHVCSRRARPTPTAPRL